jgi:hypothetical protein
VERIRSNTNSDVKMTVDDREKFLVNLSAAKKQSEDDWGKQSVCAPKPVLLLIVANDVQVDRKSECMIATGTVFTNVPAGCRGSKDCADEVFEDHETDLGWKSHKREARADRRD